MLRPTTRPLLLLATLLASACGGEKLIDRPGEQPLVDEFKQIKASSIDILFVVDNSRSMLEEHAALSQNFDQFLELVDPNPTKKGEAGEVDYRLALTTTDGSRTGGRIVGSPQVILPGLPDTLEAFRNNVTKLTDDEGSANEQGLAAAELALDTLRDMKDGGGKPLFLRDGAYLYIIILSDEEDGSFGEVRYFQRYFETIKGTGNENTVAVSAIAGPVPGGCETAAPGERYAEMTHLTGGVFGDICTTDWGATLRNLAVSGIGLRKRFQLDEQPRNNVEPEIWDYKDFVSVLVRYPCDTPEDDPHLSPEVCSGIDNQCSGKDPAIVCAPYFGEKDGWTFDERENAIVFDGNAVPGPGSTLEVRYFPRDT